MVLFYPLMRSTAMVLLGLLGAGRLPAYLAAFDPAVLARDEQLAFWINACNAYAIQLILSHDEQKSIRNINKTGGIIKGYGPWTEKLAGVGGVEYGLDHVAQKTIRPTCAEPRSWRTRDGSSCGRVRPGTV